MKKIYKGKGNGKVYEVELEEVISKPNKMAEPAQSTAESALPEPVLQGRKVNMDDAMWEDAINELDEYIDQQIGEN